MPSGTIKRWDRDRGYGFISDDQNPNKAWTFVHITKLPTGIAPEIGDAFAYDVDANRDGRPRAINLQALSAEVLEVDRIFGQG
jgi:cold shock CspA family protein